MQMYCGIDLHPDNGYFAIVDGEGKRIHGKRLRNDPEKVLGLLEKFQGDLTGVAIEATSCWYWLADLLEDNGYKVLLANPGAMTQYDGLKDANDKTDAFFIAELYRLDILPTGYIMPREQRPVRDLLRRRLLFVQLRTSLILSLLSLLGRESGHKYKWKDVERLPIEDFETILHHDPILLYTALEQQLTVLEFDAKIKKLEDIVEGGIKLRPEFEKLRTVPGIGKILGLTIMLETGDIKRFAKCGNFTSYCRCARARCTSNNKKKRNNNRKNGNKYLSWALVEAAHHCRKWCEPARKFYQRKVAKTGNVALATKALSSKLSKAAYYIMRDRVDFEVSKIFK